jgi:hypothetical protein
MEKELLQAHLQQVKRTDFFLPTVPSSTPTCSCDRILISIAQILAMLQDLAKTRQSGAFTRCLTLMSIKLRSHLPTKRKKKILLLYRMLKEAEKNNQEHIFSC